VLIPFLFAEVTTAFWPLLLAYTSEIIATLIVACVIDSKKLGGRKRIAIGGLILLSIVEVSLYLGKKSIIIASVVIIRFSIRIIWSSFIVISSESFPTRTRSLGVGITSGIGKIFGSISPFFMIPLFYVNPYLPFLVAGIISLLVAVLVFFHPLDLTCEPLDNLEKEQD